MNIIKIIKEEFNKFIDEDYPQSFDMEYFKSLPSFRKRIDYAAEHLQRLSSGSGRIVYIIDDEKVLKLAKNRKGVAQNEVEVDFSEDYYINHLFAKTFEHHPDFLWLEMEYCKKLNYARFQQLTGMSFDVFTSMVNYEYSRIKGRGRKLFSYSEPKEYNELVENEFMMSIIDYIGNYDVPAGDLTKISTYGENSNNEVVMVDYGLTNDVFGTYYS